MSGDSWQTCRRQSSSSSSPHWNEGNPRDRSPWVPQRTSFKRVKINFSALSWVKLTVSSYEETPTTWQLVQLPTASGACQLGEGLFHLLSRRSVGAWAVRMARRRRASSSDWMVTPVSPDISMFRFMVIALICWGAWREDDGGGNGAFFFFFYFGRLMWDLNTDLALKRRGRSSSSHSRAVFRNINASICWKIFWRILVNKQARFVPHLMAIQLWRRVTVEKPPTTWPHWTFLISTCYLRVRKGGIVLRWQAASWLHPTGSSWWTQRRADTWETPGRPRGTQDQGRFHPVS